MDFDIGWAGTAEAETGGNHSALRKIGKSVLGAAAIAGLMAVTALPASAEEASVAPEPEVTEPALPTLGRHVRRAARLPFNVSLKFDGEETAAGKAKRPSLARFVRARGHGSEATTVDGYGPDRLVESVTFPADAPLSNPKGTAMADVKDNAKGLAPGL